MSKDPISRRTAFKVSRKTTKNSLTLEYEKEKFIQNTCNFVEPLNFEAMQVMADQEQILETLSKLYLLCPTME